MTVKFLHDELTRILTVHPESGEARVIAIATDGVRIWPAFIAYDTKHKPPRLRLEE